jgi:hypothetical protein
LEVALEVEEEEEEEEEELTLTYLMLSKMEGEFVAVINCLPLSSSSEVEYLLVQLKESPTVQSSREGAPVHVNYSGKPTLPSSVVFKGTVVKVTPDGGELGIKIPERDAAVAWFDDSVVLDIFPKAIVSVKTGGGEGRRGEPRSSKQGGATGSLHVYISSEEHASLLDKAELYLDSH